MAQTIELRELQVRLMDFHADPEERHGDRVIARDIYSVLDDDINDSGRRPSVRMAMWSAPVTKTYISALVGEVLPDSWRDDAIAMLERVAGL